MTTNHFDAKEFLKTLTQQPGVYRMLSESGVVLYVGKAKNLRKRLSNYFRGLLDPKTQVLVEQIHHIEVTITSSENEALILEAQLIKHLKPRYNVLLRDDKSYPYILISHHPQFPRIGIYRGAKRNDGEYYGPYPNALAARNTLHLIYRMFLIRSCSDTFFANRSRPCLQYQIKRCSAPCVKYIDPKQYQQDIELARLFLRGKDQFLIDALILRMESASAAQQFEQAAYYRDKIADLRRVYAQQCVSHGEKNMDIIAIESRDKIVCIELLTVRDGQLLGNRAFFPKVPAHETLENILYEFLSQHYLLNITAQSIPSLLIMNKALEEAEWLSSALTEHAGHKVEIKHAVRGERAQLLALALKNANEALQSRLAGGELWSQRFNALDSFLPSKAPISRIECFDISHTMGEATVASCVVFGREGPIKTAYRRFNIRDIQAGDDYAAMYQALQRHYLKVENRPDILLIDGGKGQVLQAKRVFVEQGISDVMIVGVAKGVSRKPGLEQLILETAQETVRLPSDSEALHLIQQVRDEAHRFAITGHRNTRDKTRRRSTLEDIPGIGPSRRRELLRQFGGLHGIQKASVEELSKVSGISKNLAQQIFDLFHS